MANGLIRLVREQDGVGRVAVHGDRVVPDVHRDRDGIGCDPEESLVERTVADGTEDTADQCEVGASIGFRIE